jgi:murein L,D-transpeptidase YafK
MRRRSLLIGAGVLTAAGAGLWWQRRGLLFEPAPEGDYAIDYKNDKSRFHLSLHIDYPRPADRERAAELGVEPGGDILIHGQPNWLQPAADEVLSGDWTLGCVAVSNSEIERIFAAVPLGCPVAIYA